MDFQELDKVYSIMFGQYGQIIKINLNKKRSIKVVFENGIKEKYTIDGKLNKLHKKRDLIKIIEEQKPSGGKQAEINFD